MADSRVTAVLVGFDYSAKITIIVIVATDQDLSMLSNSRLPSNSRTSDWVRLAICLALLSVAAILTFIVFHDLLREASDSGFERRKEVAADDVQRVSVPMGTATLPYQRLFEATSEPGESLDAFVVRIAPRLRAYTDDTGFEACGALASDGERFGVVVGSNHGHIACVVFNARRPSGMLPTGQTLHSHPQGSRYTVNQTDLLVAQGKYRRGQVCKSPHRHADKFSLFDYEGPGYLVGAEAVHHQQGRGTERQVGAL